MSEVQLDVTTEQRMGGVVGLGKVPEHLKDPAVAVSKQKAEAHNGCGARLVLQHSQLCTASPAATELY